MKRISLDTNVFIFGIADDDPYVSKILDHLNQFEVWVALQVEREVRRNLNPLDLKEFYRIIRSAPSTRLDMQDPPQIYLDCYRQFGLKKGDAYIGAYCEWKQIELLISQNRDFLKAVNLLPFRILDAETFCRIYL